MGYAIEQYFDDVYWDESYADGIEEAEKIKDYLENHTISIWDRVNWDALEEFIEVYGIDIEHIDDIEIRVEIEED